MRLRDWPPRRMGAMWVIGIALQLLLLYVVPPLLGGEWATAEEVEQQRELRRALRRALRRPRPPVAPLEADAPTEPEVGITRTPLANGDTLLRISRDSSFLELRLSGDTMRVADASPNVDRAVTSLGRGFTNAFVEIARMVITLLTLLTAIPLILGTITLAWWIQRRRRVLV